MTTKVPPALIDAVIPTVPALDSGTYTPATTNGAQVSSSTANSCQYLRVGNVVTVSGSLSVTTTTSGTAVVSIAVPITTTFANANEAAGVAAHSSGNTPGLCSAVATTNRIALNANYPSGATFTLYFHVTYRIV